MKLIFILFMLSILFTTQSDARQPKESTIKKWVNQTDFTIESIQNVYLLDYERAYLVTVNFTKKNIKAEKGLILVRPELDEAMFIPPLPKDYIVTDLDHDGVSEIIFSQEYLYDTYTSYKRSIIQLHEYKRFELYSATYKEEKNCKFCLVEDIQWGFEDLNNNKIKDLKQDYVLYLQGPKQKLVLKKDIQEIEFNPKGLKLPFRKARLNLGSMELSKDVVDRVPVMTSQNFHLQDGRIYCLLDFKNVKHQETVTYHWIHEKLGKVLSIKQKVQPAVRFRTWLYKSLKDEEKYLGDWIIIISDKNMNILGSKEFSISKKKILIPDVKVSKEDANTTHPDSNITGLDINATYPDINITRLDTNNTTHPDLNHTQGEKHL